MTGASAIVESLKAQGVSVVFGYPGAAICPFYDALSQSGIRHILVRQEQNAGHAASGYSRISGKVGVCVTTSGPGATNLITALATAYMDSVAMVAITGQVQSSLLGRDVFQEADITGAAEPFTKHSFLVRQAEDIPRIIKEAFTIAGTGRPGPVLIDIPIDVQLEQIKKFFYPVNAEIRGYRPVERGHAIQIKRVVSAIKDSKRPLVCAGGGVISSGAQELLLEFCIAAGIPAVTTMMGLGSLPVGHPLSVGMIGTHGFATANQAVSEADLLIVLGARVGDRAINNPHLVGESCTIVHIDIDPAEIGKNLGTDIPVVGDVRTILGQLLEKSPRADSAQWTQTLGERQNAVPKPHLRTDFVNPGRFVKELSAHMEKGGIIAADVGQNQLWTARGFSVEEGRLLTSGGMGTMGYALPAAIGAKLAAPGRQVVAICGDGSFQMEMMELATLCQHDIELCLVVMKNNRLGMVGEIQQHSYQGNRTAVSLDGGPDILGIAAAYGIPAVRVENDAEADAAIRRLGSEKGPLIIECAVYPEEASLL